MFGFFGFRAVFEISGLRYFECRVELRQRAGFNIGVAVK